MLRSPTCNQKKMWCFFLQMFSDVTFHPKNIFYKIQNFSEWQLISIITHWTYTFLNPWALENVVYFLQVGKRRKD